MVHILYGDEQIMTYISTKMKSEVLEHLSLKNRCVGPTCQMWCSNRRHLNQSRILAVTGTIDFLLCGFLFWCYDSELRFILFLTIRFSSYSGSMPVHLVIFAEVLRIIMLNHLVIHRVPDGLI